MSFFVRIFCVGDANEAEMGKQGKEDGQCADLIWYDVAV